MTNAHKNPPLGHKNTPDIATGRRPAVWQLLVQLVEHRLYGWLSLAVLFGTVLFWAIESAQLNLNNADQVVSPYLFENGATFHGAQFPAQHTFLLKWPLFWLLKLWGYTPGHFVALTVFLVVATVAGLVYVLYRINSRPAVWGSLCLALAGVLLLVPAQPTAGALLPVNMAMLTTRNIEYILYIGSLVLLTRVRRLRDWRLPVVVLCLALLIASDKLFLTLSLGASLLAIITYAIARRRQRVRFAATWFLSSLAGAVIGLSILAVLSAFKVTHFVQESSVAGPYGLVKNWHEGMLGIFYAGMSYFTNFGANPAYGAVIVRDVPHQLARGLLHDGGFISYPINWIVTVVGTLATIIVLTRSVRQTEPAGIEDRPTRLTAALAWTSLVAVAAFIATDHYFAVDARYIAIVLFTAFVALATYFRQHTIRPKLVAGIAAVLLLGVMASLIGAQHSNMTERVAMDSTVDQNDSVAQTLTNHPVSYLVGDYWRVLPIKAHMTKQLINAVPLWDCQRTRQDLTSTAWQPDLHHHSFAYLLTSDTGPAGFKPCSLQSVLSAYGRPSASVLISGTLSAPRSQILFYDHGIYKPPAQFIRRPVPATVLPVPLSDLPDAKCSEQTVVTVVAHQDDDLLFMNPEQQHDIRAGDCVRTIYLTAGDSGQNRYYWVGRQQGAEAAYATMLGFKGAWFQRIVQLSPTSYVSMASPVGLPKVSLVFFSLPDGNLTGQGFPIDHHESLSKLLAGTLPRIHSVDGQSEYSSAELTDALARLYQYFGPTRLITQSSFNSKHYPDHSDHIATGHIATEALKHYQAADPTLPAVPVTYYVGYPVHGMPINVTGQDLVDTDAAYYAYAAYDKAACNTPLQCREDSTFGLYLSRNYTNPN